MERYVHVNGKKLRCGYTTGTCACGAAMYATRLLMEKMYSIDNCIMSTNIGGVMDSNSPSVIVDTPAGIPVQLDIHNVEIGPNYVSCSVIKDGGDDPDVTSGMHIFAKVERLTSDSGNDKDIAQTEETFPTDTQNGVRIIGGVGIGVVTKPGLDQPVGNAAINSTPRRYITEIVEMVKKQYGCTDTLQVTISAPEGVEIAKKTFNPRMGIEGGISIIGTTGIVEPMSNDAIVATTQLEIGQRSAKGEKILYLAPGRIGENYAKDQLGIESEEFVLCSNNIAEAFEYAVQVGFPKIVFVGHIGKLVKLGYGARNTHSANNDGRIEELILCALLAGADRQCLEQIAECVTTDGVIAILEVAELLDATMAILGKRIEDTIKRWVEGKAQISLHVFTNSNKEPRELIHREF